jgi:uncharacterized small protein (TIGR04563 family)
VSQVDTWLATIAMREPTIEDSVQAWVERIPFDVRLVGPGSGRRKPSRNRGYRADLDNIAPLPVAPKKVGATRRAAQHQSLYFHEETLQEILAESQRLDRTVSWILQQTWRLAVETIKKFPSMEKIA